MEWVNPHPILIQSNPIRSDTILCDPQYPIPIAIRPTMCTTISLILINVPEAFAFASWSASYLCAVFFDSRQQKWRKSSKNCFARQTDSDFKICRQAASLRNTRALHPWLSATFQHCRTVSCQLSCVCVCECACVRVAKRRRCTKNLTKIAFLAENPGC